MTAKLVVLDFLLKQEVIGYMLHMAEILVLLVNVIMRGGPKYRTFKPLYPREKEM